MKKFKKTISRGLPGGPNEEITEITGAISVEGYKINSPDKDNTFNIIPSSNISMKDVEFPILGTDNLGNSQVMMPGAQYTFPGDMVVELPMMADGVDVGQDINLCQVRWHIVKVVVKKHRTVWNYPWHKMIMVKDQRG